MDCSHFVICLDCPPGWAESTNDTLSEITSDDLIGSWDVSLYFSATQPPSKTEMVITETANGALIGSFYGTEFETARVTVFEGDILFTAVTRDGSGPYLTSGRLEEGEIMGQTLSIGRDFLMPWTATRVAE